MARHSAWKKYRNYRQIIEKIQATFLQRRSSRKQEVFIEIQANFHSSQNTGENCHFTRNTGITGRRAMPAVLKHNLNSNIHNQIALKDTSYRWCLIRHDSLSHKISRVVKIVKKWSIWLVWVFDLTNFNLSTYCIISKISFPSNIRPPRK